MSSIFVVTGSVALPEGLTLAANGQPVSLPDIAPLGTGSAAYFWRLPSYLEPSTTYTLTAGSSGAATEITHFTTAASYDKTPGSAPVVAGLRLWSIRYPVDEIGAGGCVFAEYEGYIDLDYQDGNIPDTDSAEVIHVLRLSPKTGGAQQSFVFAGGPFIGAWENGPSGGMTPVAEGSLPSPTRALWKPTVERGREYCATLQLYGRNDLAMEPVVSNTVCATPIEADRSGWGTPVAPSGGGCSLLPGPPIGGWAVLAFVLGGLAARRWSRRRAQAASAAENQAFTSAQ